MKKEKMMKLLLVLLPALALGLAAARDSVMVFDRLAGTTAYYGYFDLILVVNLQMCTPFAGALCGFSCGFAIGYLFAGKQWILKAVSWLAFVSAAAAAIPVLIQSDVMVVPNVGVPILMITQYLLAVLLKKKSQSAASGPEGKRLTK